MKTNIFIKNLLYKHHGAKRKENKKIHSRMEKA